MWLVNSLREWIDVEPRMGRRRPATASSLTGRSAAACLDAEIPSMTHTCAATLAGLAVVLLLEPASALARGDAAGTQAPPVRRSVPSPRVVPPRPPSHRRLCRCRSWPITRRSRLWRTMRSRLHPARRCRGARRCDGPVWPSPVTERWRFRLHVVIDPSGKVGTARIVADAGGRSGRSTGGRRWGTSRHRWVTHRLPAPAWPCSPPRGSGSSSRPMTRRC